MVAARLQAGRGNPMSVSDTTALSKAGSAGGAKKKEHKLHFSAFKNTHTYRNYILLSILFNHQYFIALLSGTFHPRKIEGVRDFQGDIQFLWSPITCKCKFPHLRP